MKSWLVALLLFLLVPLARAEDVLFIGNSFTFTYKIPDLLTAIAASKGKTLLTEAVTKGGQGWAYHLYKATATTDAALKQRPWNWVVLQDYSTNATHANEKHDFFTNGAAFDDKIAQLAPTAGIILYETWGYPQVTGEKDSVPQTPPRPASPKAPGRATPPPIKLFNTIDEMYQEIHQGYTQLLAQLHAKDPKRSIILAPVGAAFSLSRKEHPEIDLYGPDRKHPSLAGSYLSACVFYAVLFHDSPVGAAPSGPGGKPSLDPKVAATLQQIAAQVVPLK